MTPLQDQKEINRLVRLFIFTYMVSYITRTNYGAIVSEMESATGISRSLLSLAPTGSFITYGAGQIISGLCGDRFSTKKLISLGLAVTTAMNLLLPLCTGPYQMLAVWCINGFAQAFLWPPIIKTMVTLIPTEEYSRNMVKISWGSSLGTMAVYLFSPLLITVSGWRAVFFTAAGCGAAMLLVWNRCGIDVLPSLGQRQRGSASVRILFSPMMLCILAAIVFHGMLRDSVMTWMPAYISETYRLPNSAAILSGVILPIFSLICFHITEKLHRRVLPNLLTCAGAIFAVSALAAGTLYLFSGAGAALAVLLLATIRGCTSGINLLFTTILPTHFKKHGNISTVSGVLNSCTYIGSAISTYGIALVSEQFGWSTSILIWLVLSISGAALCGFNIPVWRKETE